MTAADVLEAGPRHVMLATGSAWQRDGIGRYLSRPVQGSGNIFTPDDLMNGKLPQKSSHLRRRSLLHGVCLRNYWQATDAK